MAVYRSPQDSTVGIISKKNSKNGCIWISNYHQQDNGESEMDGIPFRGKGGRGLLLEPCWTREFTLLLQTRRLVCPLCAVTRAFHGRMCVAECPRGFWGDRRRCKRCYSSCESCTGSRSDQCSSCQAGHHLTEGASTCTALCGDGFYLDHGWITIFFLLLLFVSVFLPSVFAFHRQSLVYVISLNKTEGFAAT